LIAASRAKRAGSRETSTLESGGDERRPPSASADTRNLSATPEIGDYLGERFVGRVDAVTRGQLAQIEARLLV
jgi:hypothetical protein